MPAGVIGGNIAYPNLQTIADLFRVQINDSMAGATGTAGEGLIMTNTNPDLLTFLNAACRDTFADLRNVGDPALILDNYILTGLPALAASDPTVQVSLAYQGFFDGFQWHPQWTLPISCQRVERIWERWTGVDENFIPMSPAPNGLPGVWQVQRMGYWEARQNAIWMPGCLESVDLRLRCRISFPDFLNPATINFNTAYVPILNCSNLVVAKMLVLYSKRFAPDAYQMCIDDEERQLKRMRKEVVLNLQNTEYQRAEWGEEAVATYGWLVEL